MTLDVWRDSQQSAGFIICVLTLPICTIATALRFVATAKSKREYGVENWFALIALVFFLVYTSIFLYRKSSRLSAPEEHNNRSCFFALA